jgi:hypothetical protein
MTASVPLGWLSVDEQMDYFQAAIKQNCALMEILSRAPKLDIPDWYLASGCLFQTVWNVVTGQPPESGISDYDLIYFDGSDLSWEAEDAVIQRGKEIFAGLDAARIEIRNQARVHLWYEAKFGIACQPHRSSEGAIDTFHSTVSCIGVRLRPDGEWHIYAPRGFSDIFNLLVRPNAVLASAEVYAAKTARWKRHWPSLTILPWPEKRTILEIEHLQKSKVVSS